MEGFLFVGSVLVFGAIGLVFVFERMEQNRMNKDKDAAAQRRLKFEMGNVIQQHRKGN